MNLFFRRKFAFNTATWSSQIDQIPFMSNGNTDGGPMDPGSMPFDPMIVPTQTLQTSDTDSAMANYISYTLGNSQYDSRVNSMYMGERFNSFRALCKRHVVSFPFSANTGIDYSYVKFIPWLPPEPGNYTPDGTAIFTPPWMWTYPGWFSLLFRGVRGSMRVNVLPYINAYGRDTGQLYVPTVAVWRGFSTKISEAAVEDPLDVSQFDANYFAMMSQSGKGYELFNSAVGQMISFSIPFQHVVGCL
jgi:hypothetical protein